MKPTFKDFLAEEQIDEGLLDLVNQVTTAFAKKFKRKPTAAEAFKMRRELQQRQQKNPQGFNKRVGSASHGKSEEMAWMDQIVARSAA